MTDVMTVTGPIAIEEMGVVLTHEHIFNDVTSWAKKTTVPGVDPDWYWSQKVTQGVLWELRNDPFGNRDNCILDDFDVAEAELQRFVELGGRTICDATSVSSGRDLRALKRISVSTGVNIVAGTGFYLEASMDEVSRNLSEEQVAREILRDIEEGEDGVHPGMIGEIGVGADFPASEQRSLRGALIAAAETALPIQVHLPAWFRRGHEVLDLMETYGVSPRKLVLCHMGPSGHDTTYQHELLERGAWVQYDMIGMEVFYADQGVQCPSDEENASRIVDLFDAGYGDQLLISQDIFLKSLLRTYGGPGYGHLLQYFLPRLLRHGLKRSDLDRLVVGNPKKLFEPLADER